MVSWKSSQSKKTTQQADNLRKNKILLVKEVGKNDSTETKRDS